MPYVFNCALSGNVTEVADNLDKYKMCSICARKLQLIKAVFKIMEDEYGDIGFGLWQCPTHLNFIYYPALLKKAVDHGLDMVTVGGRVHYVRYTNIVALGHPWRCPICGKRLIYTDEKHKYAY